MGARKGEYGWWDGKGYLIVTKRRVKLVDGKRHRVVELKLVYNPPSKKEGLVLTTQDWTWEDDKTLWVPVGNFQKYFKIDNTIGLLFEKEKQPSEEA